MNELAYSLVSINSEFDYKYHIIFPNLVVNAETRKQLYANIKKKYAVDSTVSNLRMLFCPKKDKTNYHVPIIAMDRVEALKAYSILRVDEEYTPLKSKECEIVDNDTDDEETPEPPVATDDGLQEQVIKLIGDHGIFKKRQENLFIFRNNGKQRKCKSSGMLHESNNFNVFIRRKNGNREFVYQCLSEKCKEKVIHKEEVDEEDEEKTVVEELNKKWQFLNTAKPMVIDNDVFRTLKDFKDANNTDLIQKADKTITKAEYWYQSRFRKQFNKVVFKPCVTDVVADDEYNMWKGFTVEPAQNENYDEDVAVFENHLINILANKDVLLGTYLIKYMAWVVQRLGQSKVAIVLRGLQQIGKGIIVEKFGELFGQHFYQSEKLDTFIGRFNAVLARSNLLFMDECLWGGKKSDVGSVKAIITQTTISVEPKGVDAMNVKIPRNIFIASNEDWVIPASSDSCRFVCCAVNPEKRGDRKYFNRIAQIDNANLLYYLQHVDIEGFDPQNDAPMTDMLKEQIELSKSSIEMWFDDCVECAKGLKNPTHCFGGNDSSETGNTWAKRKDVYDSYARSVQGGRVEATNMFWVKMRKVCPKLEEKKVNGDRKVQFPTC